MGKVIAFQPRTKATPTHRGPLQRDAEILFFLGVRYVRMDDARSRTSESETCGAPPNGGKRRRRVRA